MPINIAGSGTKASAFLKWDLPPFRKEKVEVDASHRAAEMEIHTRNPYMDADWDQVWEERGFLKPMSIIKEQAAKAQREGAKNISQTVSDGLRIRNIHIEKGNIYGKLAFEKFINGDKPEVRLMAVPKYGVRIDVRIYPPEIHVEPRGKGVSGPS